MLFVLGVLVIGLGLIASIALHEIGHLLPAKRSGVKVTQYMVGFGRTVWSRRRGETEYGLKMIPLGGYIRMIGMYPPRRKYGEDAEHLRVSSTGYARTLADNSRHAAGVMIEQIAPEDADRVFYKLPVRWKLLIMVGGPAMNLLLGILILAPTLAIAGNVEATTQIRSLSECVRAVTSEETADECTAADVPAPALAAGLQPGETIVAVDGRAMPDWDTLVEVVEASPGEPLTLTVRAEGGATRDVVVTPVLNVKERLTGEREEVGFLGVEPRTDLTSVPLGEVPGRIGEQLQQTAGAIVRLPARMVGVWQAAFGGERDVNGPVGVVGIGRIGGEVADTDRLNLEEKVVTMALILGSLNLFLFVFNMVPLLPLDGGHIAGALWEATRRRLARLRGRPDPGYVDVARLLPVAYVVGAAMLVMGMVLIVGDLVVPLHIDA